jgi:hypothetical protein
MRELMSQFPHDELRIIVVAQDWQIYHLNPLLTLEGCLSSMDSRPTDDLPKALVLEHLKIHQAQKILWRQFLSALCEI